MKLILWTLPNSGLKTVSHLDVILKKFRRSNPDITIKPVVLIDKTLWQRLFLCAKEDPGFETPDLVEIPHHWTALFSKLGMLADLTKLSPGLSLKNYIDPLKTHCYLPETKKIHSIPWWMSVTALHYRVDHLKKITKNPEELLKTWDGLLHACAKLKKVFRSSDYFPIANSSLRGSMNLREVLPLIWERGGDIFNKDLTKAVIRNKRSLRGIEDFLTLFRKGYMPLMRERGSLGTMSEGKSSMILTRRQSQAAFDRDAQSQMSLKTLPIPGRKGSSVSFMTSYNLAVLNYSSKKRQAFRLLRWLCRQSASVKYSNMIKAFPPSIDGFEEFIFSSHERMQTYSEIVANARCLPTTAVCATYIGILDEVLASICRDIVIKGYSSGLLSSKIEKVQKEIDHILSLYGD